jgi:hypothetical protein
MYLLCKFTIRRVPTSKKGGGVENLIYRGKLGWREVEAAFCVKRGTVYSEGYREVGSQ